MSRREQGFTLIELLVVMVLMALLSAAAISTLRFSFGDDDIETEARRIGALVNLAAEEALLTGREIGMELDQRQISFWEFEPFEQRWLALGQDDGPFRSRTLPDGIETDLVLEGQPVVLGEDGEDDDDDQPEPQVLMFSSGQMTPFTLLLEDRDIDAEWRIEADLLGRVTVEAVE